MLLIPNIALNIKKIDKGENFSAKKALIKVIITAAEIIAGSFFKIDDKTLIIITNEAAERI